MKIIDVHAHTGRWQFQIQATDRDIPGMLDHYGIDKIVLSSAQALMDDLSEGNDVNYRVVEADERCYGYVVINPNHYAESVQNLKKYLGKRKIVGVKMHPAQFANPVDSQASRDLVRIVNSYGYPILIHAEETETARPSRILSLAEEFPNNTYIIAHMGNAWWREALDTAAKRDNIYVDIVTSISFFDLIKIACQTIGPDHVMYGSDYHLLEPAFSLGMVMSSEIDESARSSILYQNAERVFRFA
jgi:uncharacterized protein